LTLNPEIRRGFGAHEADPNAAHPNQGKANNHGGRAEYHYGWEVVHTTHGKDRMTGGRSSTLALPGKFDNHHDNNKDFTHRMIRGIHHRRLNQESEVRFRSREHDQTVVTNVHPDKKQIRIMTILPKGRHAKGALTNSQKFFISISNKIFSLKGCCDIIRYKTTLRTNGAAMNKYIGQQFAALRYEKNILVVEETTSAGGCGSFNAASSCPASACLYDSAAWGFFIA
jgi:hypothetical protein